jgi:hypothetical protein
MPLNTFRNLLGSTEELKAVTARVRRLKELQSLYARTAPRELVSSSRVKSCRAGTLFVWADNAAVAAKLKQLAPRLLASIRENEAEITKIRIEVQVGGREGPAVYESRKKALTPGAVSKIGDLALNLPDGRLKAALSRLASRHAGPLQQDRALQDVENHRDDHHDERELKRAPRPREIAPVAGVEEKAERDRHRQ